MAGRPGAEGPALLRRGRRKPEGSAWASSSTRMTGPASSVMAGRTASRKTPTAGRSSIGADRFRTPTDVVSYDERVDRPHRAGSERPETIGHPLTPEASHGAAFGCGADGRRARDKRRPSSMETGRDRPGALPHRDRDRRPGSGRGNISAIRGRFEAGPGALQPPVAAQRPALPRRRWAGAGVQRDLVRGLPRSGRPRGRGPRG